MKSIATFLLLLAGSTQNFAQVTWSSAITVTGGSFGYQHPRVALNRSGNPYVLWGQSGSTGKAYFSKWMGTMFSTPTLLNTTFDIAAASWTGPDLAAFGDTVYVTLKRTPEMTSYSYLIHSYNGGSTFSAPVRIDNIGADMSRFPVVTTTTTGQPLISYMRFDSGTMGNPRYVVERSTDWGNTFTADVLASSSGTPVCDCCPGALVSSGSNVIMLYRNDASNIRDTWAAISADGGMTFSGPGHVNVDNNAWMFMSCPSTGPDGIVIGDTLFTVFRSGTTPRVYLSRSSVSGMSYASRDTITTGTIPGFISQDFPRIAHSGIAATTVFKQVTSLATGIIYSFANDIHTGFTTFDTIAVSSSVVNADVAMSPGTIHVVWEDASGKVMYKKGTYGVTTEVPVINKEMITVYPNPANDNFTVSMNGVIKIKSCYLSDITGKQSVLVPDYSSGNAVFSLKGTAKGNYYFAMTDEVGKIFYSKLLVQ